MRLQSKEGQKPPGERCSEKQMTGQQTADQETCEISGYNQGTKKIWVKNRIMKDFRKYETGQEK